MKLKPIERLEMMMNIARICLLPFVLCLSLTGSASAYIFVTLNDIDDYVKYAKTVLIVECLPADEAPEFKDAYVRKVSILDVLQGEATEKQIIHVVVGRSLKPGDTYIIYSGEAITDSKLDATQYEPAVIPVAIYGETTKDDKEKDLATFTSRLKPLTLKEKFVELLNDRLRDLKYEQQALQEEKKKLNKLVPK